MEAADLGIFNLTPFRGVGADVGTVFELGALIAAGKPAFGYSNDPDDLLTRMRKSSGAFRTGDAWHDRDLMTIEDFGNADNLMVDASLAVQGRPLVRSAVPFERRYRDLRGFEECLRMAQAEFPAIERPGLSER